jgi:hypothetical protein
MLSNSTFKLPLPETEALLLSFVQEHKVIVIAKTAIVFFN